MKREYEIYGIFPNGRKQTFRVQASSSTEARRLSMQGNFRALCVYPVI